MTQAPRVAVGWSATPDAFAAGQTAARTATQQLTTRRVRCAIVLGSSWLDQAALLRGVRSIVQGPLIGGSTAGEITPEGPKSHSCVVLAIAEEAFACSLGAGTELERDPRSAGYQAAQEALRQFTGARRSGFLLFGDGLSRGYAEVLRGVQEVLGTSSLVTGGLMGDDLRFAMTYQYAQERVFSRGVAGLLAGGCSIGVGLEHGFAPISKPRRVTRARANILHELDGKPASLVYEEYFGDSLMKSVRQGGLTRQLIAYPLGVQLDSTGQFLLRTIMAFGADGSLVCTGEVSEGTWVQLMIGSKESALEAATAAARKAVQSLRSVWFALVFNSVVRKRLLGQEAAREVGNIRQVLGAAVPVAGCYTYGEQAPLGTPHTYGRSSVQTGACLVIAVGPENS
ncbi:MAG: FIST C-terminal domain-containing protein [Candidatus Omnitrophica bacterium]|nr:FIST C-terminal domain-containing protein [Candidatus Omnitrophota bacterium]